MDWAHKNDGDAKSAYTQVPHPFKKIFRQEEHKKQLTTGAGCYIIAIYKRLQKVKFLEGNYDDYIIEETGKSNRDYH
jgi:hypothetical protein